MARFYRGAGVGTYWHQHDGRVSGISPHKPLIICNVSTFIHHIALGTTASPCVSLTKSYGVAEMYALNASRARPTQSNPSFVYEIDISPSDNLSIVDPVAEIAKNHADPLNTVGYHHDGDMNFLLGVVDPTNMAAYLANHVRQPPGSTGTPRPANLPRPLEALVRALRDAEVLVVQGVPQRNVVNRIDVY